MLKKAQGVFAAIAMTIAAIASASAADQVTFTTHSFPDTWHIFSTYACKGDTPVATVDDSKANCCEYTLYSSELEEVYSFSIDRPVVSSMQGSPEYIQNLMTSRDQYITSILVSQYLFNDDDLYEVIFEFYDSESHEGTYYVVNENGEILGKMPTDYPKLVEIDGIPYFSGEGPDFLISINTTGVKVAEVKSNPNTPKMQVRPNPIAENAEVLLVLPETIDSDITVRIFSLKGEQLFQKECRRGERMVSVSADLLTTGVNPAIAIDGEGNILCTAKIIKE